MNIQSFKNFNQPRTLQRPDAPKPGGPSEDKTFVLNDHKETFEVVGCALLTGFVCGLSADALGSGWGAVTSVTGATVGWAGYGYISSNKDGYEKLGAAAGGVSGLVMGGVGAAGAALGGLTGHPLVGGLLAGCAMAALGAYQQSR